MTDEVQTPPSGGVYVVPEFDRAAFCAMWAAVRAAGGTVVITPREQLDASGRDAILAREVLPNGDVKYLALWRQAESLQ